MNQSLRHGSRHAMNQLPSARPHSGISRALPKSIYLAEPAETAEVRHLGSGLSESASATSAPPRAKEGFSQSPQRPQRGALGEWAFGPSVVRRVFRQGPEYPAEWPSMRWPWPHDLQFTTHNSRLSRCPLSPIAPLPSPIDSPCPSLSPTLPPAPGLPKRGVGPEFLPRNAPKSTVGLFSDPGVG